MEILAPIFICVVLPIAIVGILAYTKINAENRRAQILTKAIETNNNIDTEKLTEILRSMEKSTARSARDKVAGRLLRGCIFTLVGFAFIGIAFITPDYKPSESPALCCALISLAVGISFLIVYFVTRRQVDQS